MSLQSSMYQIIKLVLFLIINISAFANNKPFSELTYKERFKGNIEHKTATYVGVREDSNIGSLFQLPLEFSKNSNKDGSNLHITSDTLIINKIKQKLEYLGNTVVYFDDAILRTEELYIFYKIVSNKKTINYIVIPNKLTIERKINNEVLLADSAKYFPDNKQLILLGNVVLQRDDNILKTNKLIYYVDLKQ